MLRRFRRLNFSEWPELQQWGLMGLGQLLPDSKFLLRE